VPQRRKTAAARFADYSGLALLLPISTFVGYLIGHFLDKWLGTSWLTVVFIILGSAAGFVELIRHIMQDSRDDDDS
jgi:F0F1-type ATP synthase assembly protein I